MLLNQIEKDLDWFFRTPSMDQKVLRYPLTNLGVNQETDTLHVEVAVAGFKKEEISIETKGNRIIITGEREAELDNGVTYMQRNISASNFERTIILHENYVGGDVDASMEDGILTITVQPKEQTKKLISIN